MPDFMGEGLYEAGIREHQQLAYDRIADELDAQYSEDRRRGYVDIGGYNVPSHLQGLVSEHGVHPDRVCAIADLYDSTDDFTTSLQTASTDHRDHRLDEVAARWIELDAEEAAQQ